MRAERLSRPADDPLGLAFWRLAWRIIREGIAYRLGRVGGPFRIW